MSWSTPKPDDKQREKRTDGQLVTESAQDFNLAFRDKERIMGAISASTIKYLSLWSAVIKR